ncbi:MAG TPA: hypothetical protein V6C65_03540, partial [Allocoleopsis sp.]
MTDATHVNGGGGIDDLTSLLNLLGGQKTTTSSTADIAPLLGLLKTLQGQDYTQQLQGIFQEAAGQIPGLTAALATASGGRPQNNGVLSAGLQNLLMQTTLAGQKQIAEEQAQNAQTQANVASSIANATKSQTQQQGTNIPQAGQRGAKVVAGLAGANQLMQLLGMGGDALKKLGLGGGSGSGIPTVDFSGDVGSVANSFDSSSLVAPTVDTSSFADQLGDISNISTAADSADAGSNALSAVNDVSDAASALTAANDASDASDAVSAAGDLGSAGDDSSWLDDLGSFFGFKNGGLVGRDKPT